MIISRVRSELESWRHQTALAKVLRTAPVDEGHPGVVVFSQVCARDFLMYLLAAKSFARHTEGGRFAVLDDGSLTTEHHELLRKHLRGIAIHHIDEVHSDATPGAAAGKGSSSRWNWASVPMSCSSMPIRSRSGVSTKLCDA
jgi:hypothetical protein